MVAELFVTRDSEFQTAGAVVPNALDWKSPYIVTQFSESVTGNPVTHSTFL